MFLCVSKHLGELRLGTEARIGHIHKYSYMYDEGHIDAKDVPSLHRLVESLPGPRVEWRIGYQGTEMAWDQR